VSGKKHLGEGETAKTELIGRLAKLLSEAEGMGFDTRRVIKAALWRVALTRTQERRRGARAETESEYER
jgi:hypothetical protein